MSTATLELDVNTSDLGDVGLVLLRRGDLTIRSAEEYASVAEGLQRNKGWQKRVREWFAPLKAKANEAHKTICQRENETLAAAIEDEKARKDALERWDSEQRRIAAEAQRVAEAEARRQEEARRVSEAAALEAEANATGDGALRSEAYALIERPIETPAVAREPAVPNVAGLSFTDKWEVEVDDKRRPVHVDLRALCAAIGRGEVPTSYVELNVGAINAVFQGSQGQTTIPGVPCRHRRVPSSRAR